MEVDLQAILITTLEEENDLQVPAVLFRCPLIRRLPEPQNLKVKHFSCRQMNPVYPVSHSTDLPRSLDWSQKESESSFCSADYSWQTIRGPPQEENLCEENIISSYWLFTLKRNSLLRYD